MQGSEADVGSLRVGHARDHGAEKHRRQRPLRESKGCHRRLGEVPRHATGEGPFSYARRYNSDNSLTSRHTDGGKN